MRKFSVYLLLISSLLFMGGCFSTKVGVSEPKEIYPGSGVYAVHMGGNTHSSSKELTTGQTLLVNEADKTITPMASSSGTVGGDNLPVHALHVGGGVAESYLFGSSIKPDQYYNNSNVNANGGNGGATTANAQNGPINNDNKSGAGSSSGSVAGAQSNALGGAGGNAVAGAKGGDAKSVSGSNSTAGSNAENNNVNP